MCERTEENSLIIHKDVTGIPLEACDFSLLIHVHSRKTLPVVCLIERSKGTEVSSDLSSP